MVVGKKMKYKGISMLRRWYDYRQALSGGLSGRRDWFGCAFHRQVVALNLPAGQWHTVRALESGSVILEMKEGAYEPIGPEDVMEL